MPKSKQAQTGAGSDRDLNVGAGYYVFCRFWPGWYGDSGFPFERFNGLPDDQFVAQVEEFIKTNDECKAKLTEALKRLSGQGLRRPRRRVRNWFDTLRRQGEVESWSWPDIQRHAESLGLSCDKQKPELVKQILEEEEWRLECERDRSRANHDTTAYPKGGRKELICRGLEDAPLLAYLRVMKWCYWFSEYDYDKSPASRRHIVWRAGSRDEAERVASALQTQLSGTNLCPKFGVLPERDFPSQDRVTIQRTMEVLSGNEPLPSYITVKLDFPEVLREVVREASGLAGTLAEIKNRQQLGDEGLPSGSATDGPVKRQRGRRKTDEATMKKEADLLARWVAARETGKSRKEFAKPEGITVAELERIRARVKQRKKRKKR